MVQLKLLFISSLIIGTVFAQRGHYAGNRRVILGSRYQTADAAQASPGSVNDRFDGNSNALNPSQQYNGYRPSQHGFDSYQQSGFGGNFPNQGFQHQAFPFNGPYNFYGR